MPRVSLFLQASVAIARDNDHRTHIRFSTEIILIDEWIQLRENMSHRIDGCVRAMTVRYDDNTKRLKRNAKIFLLVLHQESSLDARLNFDHSRKLKRENRRCSSSSSSNDSETYWFSLELRAALTCTSLDRYSSRSRVNECSQTPDSQDEENWSDQHWLGPSPTTYDDIYERVLDSKWFTLKFRWNNCKVRAC